MQTTTPRREVHVRRALGLKAPPGRAPLCKATAKNKYSCFDSNWNYKNRTFRLDTNIQHVKTTHFKINDVNLSVSVRNIYLPRKPL